MDMSLTHGSPHTIATSLMVLILGKAGKIQVLTQAIPCSLIQLQSNTMK